MLLFRVLLLAICVRLLLSNLSDASVLQSIYSLNVNYGMKTIILIGPTGAGKSTLGNLLANHKLKSYYHGTTNQCRYKLADNHPDASSIGNTLSSETLIPVSVRLTDYRDRIILDVPGIEENRGILHQLVSAYSQKLIYNNTNDIMLVLVLQEDNFIGKSEEVERVLEWLNIGDQVVTSVALVVTKVTLGEDELRELLKAKAKELSFKMANGAALFEYIIANENYAYLARPNCNERNNASDRSKVKIWDLLNSVEFTKRFAFGSETRSFNYKSRLQLRTLEKELSREMTELIVRLQFKVKDLKLKRDSLQYVLMRSISNGSAQFWQHLLKLSELPALKIIIENELLVFHGLLAYVGEDWAKMLDITFRHEIAKSIDMLLTRTDEAADLSFTQKFRSWWPFSS